jgi:hypothetical protein
MAYQSEITRPGLGLPNFETVAKRKGEYTTNKSNAERDEEPDKLIQKCNELKASEGTASSGSGNAIGGAEGGE